MKILSSAGMNSTSILVINILIAWHKDFKGTKFMDIQKVLFRHVSD